MTNLVAHTGCGECGQNTARPGVEHLPMCSRRRGTEQPVDVRCAECGVHGPSGKIEHDSTCSHRVATVLTEATVTVKDAVDGTVKRRTRGPNKPKAAIDTHEIRVDPRVWLAARAICTEHQRIVIVSATEVKLVNK